MDISILAGVVIVCALLAFIAEPKRFMILSQEKTPKKVGSTYWGIYEGTPSEEPESMRTVELKDVARKEVYIAGSSTYSMGRGVNMSGRK